MNYDRDGNYCFNGFCGLVCIVVFLGSTSCSDGAKQGKECIRMGVTDLGIISVMEYHSLVDSWR